MTAPARPTNMGAHENSTLWARHELTTGWVKKVGEDLTTDSLVENNLRERPRTI